MEPQAEIQMRKYGYLSQWRQQSSVFLLSVLCYINSIWGGFVFDDNEAILNNQDLDLENSWTQVFQNDFWGTDIFSNSSHKSYRPLTVLSFRLNSWLANGLNPASFHLINVILHGITSVLYFHVCIAICIYAGRRRDSLLVSTIASLMFATHPIHTESVSYCQPSILCNTTVVEVLFFLCRFQVL